MKFAAGLMTFVLSTVAVLAMADRVYKWVDENGTVHFGQKPSVSHQSTAVDIRTGYSTLQLEQEQEQDQAETTGEEPAVSAEEEYCRLAKENYEVLTTSNDVTREDEYGVEKLLTEDEKRAQLARAQAAMDRYCTPQNQQAVAN